VRSSEFAQLKEKPAAAASVKETIKDTMKELDKPRLSSPLRQLVSPAQHPNSPATFLDACRHRAG
jgi:hypothetical protein